MSNLLRYSQRPAPEYQMAQGSTILASDPEAWNMAWLSFDVESGHHPDPEFTVHIRRTLDYCFLTKDIDLVCAVPAGLKVRHLFALPPPRAAKRVLSMRDRENLPMFQAYGAGWFRTMLERSYLWRAPFDVIHDAPVTDFTDARRLLDAIAHQ